MKRPITIFFSYSHKDEDYRNELEVHLAPLKRQGVIDTWHDRRIGAGKEIHPEISEHLESADVILLLVSPYFIASDYCYEREMSRALERHQQSTARVVPVIVHPCDWHEMPFGSLRATPTDGKPLSKFANPHDGYVEVAKDIRLAAKELGLEAVPPAEAAAPRERDVQAVEDVRTSNLRVRRDFSEREKDDFIEASFEYIARFFDNSLAELEKRNKELETRFKRLDLTHFTAAVYQREKKTASCRIWLSREGRLNSQILYSYGDGGSDNAYNEALSVADDGYQLLLKPMGMTTGRAFPETASQHGAGEFLWSLLIASLQ